MRRIGWILVLYSALMAVHAIARPAVASNGAEKGDWGKKAASALEKAHKLANRQDYENALKLLKPFIHSKPVNATILSDYTVFEFWAGNTRNAIALFESMPESIPRRPYLIRNMAKAYLDVGQNKKAASCYAQVVEKDPGDMIAKRGLILSLMRQKQYAAAEAKLRQFLRTDPDATELQLLDVELRFRNGHYTDALFQLHTLVGKGAIDPKRGDRLRESLVASVSADEQGQLLAELKKAADAGAANAVSDYVVVLVSRQDYDRALAYLDTSPLKADQLPASCLYWIAWANFKTGRLSQAENIFKVLIHREPEHSRGPIGLAYVYAARGDTKRALNTLDEQQPKSQADKLERCFAIAYVYETAGRFPEAIAVYDELLSEFPGNQTAARLRLYAISDMGANSEALRQAMEAFPEDKELHRNIKARKAVNYIKWEEPDKAIAFLNDEIRNDPGSPLRFEYIAALVAARYDAEAIAAYEMLEAEGVQIPAWVSAKAAEAYLSERRPEKALALYTGALSRNPDLWETRMGRFNALKDLRRWQAAEKELQDMKAGTLPILGYGEHKTFNPDLLDLYIERGWLLAYEDRLMEADAYFAALRQTAPANLDIRNGQAHIAAWRGWNRKALDQFSLITSLDPAYLSAEPGKIIVLDALARKEEARRDLAEMIAKHPRDKRFQRVQREFEVDGMHALSTGMAFQREDDGTNDILLQADVSTPVSLYTRLHAFSLFRRTWNDDLSAEQKAAGEDEAAYFRRAGIGIDHIFNNTWELRQQFSVDYHEGGDFGSCTRLHITPDDHWSIEAIVDTFSTDVPARARTRDIDAVNTAVNTVYRVNETREYSLLLNRQWFSDDNNRDELQAGISQLLWVKNDWQMRLSGSVYYSANSEYDDPDISYFNPKNAWGVSVTHMTEQIIWARYDQSFIHRLFLSAGNYKQYDYDNALVASARYEQDLEFTDTHSLRWAIDAGRNVYDGDSVLSGALEIMYIWRF